MKLGDLIIAMGAVRDEGLTKSYIDSIYPTVADHELVLSLKQAAERLDIGYHLGIVRSHDTIYSDREKDVYAYYPVKGCLAQTWKHLACSYWTVCGLLLF